MTMRALSVPDDETTDTVIEPSARLIMDEADSGVRVWCVGTGSPRLDGDRVGACVAFAGDGTVTLVDCGIGSLYRLTQLGIGPAKVETVLLTHHHIDHNGDLPSLIVARWIAMGKHKGRPLRIIGPEGTRMFVDRALSCHEQDIVARGEHGWSIEDLIPEVTEFQDGDQVTAGSVEFKAFEVEHSPVPHAFGYRAEREGIRIVISGDTRPCAALVDNASQCHLLIHEAIYPGYGIPEYHSLAEDVGRLSAEAGVKRLVLTHLIPGTLPESVWIDAASREYSGPIVVAQDLLQVAGWAAPGADPFEGIECWGEVREYGENEGATCLE